MSDSLIPQSPDPDEPDFQKMLSELLGSNADNPAARPRRSRPWASTGSTRPRWAMISAQLQAMFSVRPR